MLGLRETPESFFTASQLFRGRHRGALFFAHSEREDRQREHDDEKERQLDKRCLVGCHHSVPPGEETAKPHSTPFVSKAWQLRLRHLPSNKAIGSDI